MLFKFDQQQYYNNPKEQNPTLFPIPQQRSLSIYMQNQYPKKIANLLRNSPSIIPTSYELFYSLLKLICNNITHQQITPQLLDQLSKMYKSVKQRIQVLDYRYRSDVELQINSFQNKRQQQQCLSNCAKMSKQAQHTYLQELIKPFLKYLPKKYIATLISKHFFDNQFYTTIAQTSLKAYDMIIGNSSIDSGSMTPLVRHNTHNNSNSNKFQSQKCSFEFEKQSQMKSCIKQQPYSILNNIIKNRVSLNNKLHINGNNQLSIIFWLISFKFDYAVHFDVFWTNLLKYLNTILTPPLINEKHTKNTNINSNISSKLFYPIFFPFDPTSASASTSPSTSISNCSLKSKIKQIVDPYNKYYVTSASCDQLFKEFNQPQFLELLIQLTLSKKQIKEQKKSSQCLIIRYRWRRSNQGSSQSQGQSQSLSKNIASSSLQKRGTVLINNFSTPKEYNSPSNSNPNSNLNPVTSLNISSSSLPITTSQQLPQQTQILLTGSSIALNTKIFQSRYPPTIRFGSLTDNQICIKNKYVSRRQFMIIQQQIRENQSNCFGLNNSDNGNKYNKDNDDASYDVRFNKQDNTLKIKDNNNKGKNNQSKYFIVCLSPSNHTCLVYQEEVQVRTGMIFKFQGIYVQIVKAPQSISNNNENGEDIKNGNQIKKQSKQQLYHQKQLSNSESQVQIQDLSLSKQTLNFNDNFNNGGLLTGIPASKIQQISHQQPSQSEDQDPTLQYLPKQPYSPNQFKNNNILQVMCISGQQKGKKIQLQYPYKSITVNNKIFQFFVKNNRYFVPRNIQILVKNANQVLSGHLSDKIQLKAGMKLVLEQIQFQILE